MKKWTGAIRPDAQGFDEIRLITVPRFKTSGLSGEEWRISIKVEFWRKGCKILSENCGSGMKYALMMLPYKYLCAVDDGHGYFGHMKGFCDQEGCSKEPTVYYKVKEEYCVGGGNCGQKIEREEKWFPKRFRAFCEEHKTRGDCDLEDNDKNYEVIRRPPDG